MKCVDVQTHLLESLYGELRGEEEARLREHLGGCPDCRQEMEALRQTSRQLNVVPRPPASLDVGRLYRTAAERSGRSRRRWRRLAGTAAVAAVLLLAIAVARLRLEWQPGQLVVSFGGRPPAAEPIQPKGTDQLLASLNGHEKRLETLEEIAALLSAELGTSDSRHTATQAELRRGLARSQAQIELLARQMNVRWRLAEQDIRDLYLAQFSPNPNQKGAMP